MTRALEPAMSNAVGADYVRPILLVHCDFDSGDLNMWTGIGSLVYDGKTYVGTGNLLNISGLQETTQLTAQGITVTLSGVLSSLVEKARDEDYQGRTLEVLFGAIDDNGDIIADPAVMFSGFMDTMTILDGGETATIAISVENRLIEFERTRIRRYTAEDQKIDYPDDQGLEFVADLEEKEIVWGRMQVFASRGGNNETPPEEGGPQLP